MLPEASSTRRYEQPDQEGIETVPYGKEQLRIFGRYEQPDQEGIEISGLDVGMPVVGHVAMSLMADLRSSLKFRRVMSLR